MTLQKLSDRHEAMLYALVLEGKTSKEVCEEFGITQSHLSIIRKSPIWQQREAELRSERDRLRKEILESSMLKLESLREPAIKALEECVYSDDENIKLKSAKEILDRTGLGTSTKEEEKVQPVINLYIPTSWKNGGDNNNAKD